MINTPTFSDQMAEYDRAIPARLKAPNPRDAVKDAAAREQRSARATEFQNARSQKNNALSKLAEAIEGEKNKLQGITQKYEAILRDPDKTHEAFHLRVQMDVFRERIDRLEADAGKLRQDLSAIDADLLQIAAEEAKATEAEAREELRAELGQRASELIESIAAELRELRSIAIEARYRSNLLQTADDIADVFRIRIVKGVLKFIGTANSLEAMRATFEQFLKAHDGF